MIKTLDQKLQRIHANPKASKDFILADAKDPDMAMGIAATGKSPESHSGEARYRTLAEFRDIIVQIVEQKLVDIMLMSASTAEVMAQHRKLFENSPVTPAARANDTSDIWVVRGGRYPSLPSRSFINQLPFLPLLKFCQCRGSSLATYLRTFAKSALSRKCAP